MLNKNIKLIIIIGPTASGKTQLALELAQQYQGEVICADSRTIYRGMDIGTAKPTAQERALVPHHLLDIAAPNEIFSAQQFKSQATALIGDISSRGRVPFMVGGTGLYAYSVAYDFQFPAGPRTADRAELEQVPLPELVARLEREDPERAAEIDLKNPRRVIRALETMGQPRQKAPALPSNILLLGLRPDMESLNNKIVQRTRTMFQIGLVAEVQKIMAEYGSDLEVLRSPGYAEIIDALAGKSSLVEAELLINLHTRQLVKRQLTWFKRNPDIHWLEDAAAAEPLVRAFLATP
jgi:tRNA dimethylallyltransferase